MIGRVVALLLGQEALRGLVHNYKQGVLVIDDSPDPKPDSLDCPICEDFCSEVKCVCDFSLANCSCSTSTTSSSDKDEGGGESVSVTVSAQVARYVFGFALSLGLTIGLVLGCCCRKAQVNHGNEGRRRRGRGIYE